MFHDIVKALIHYKWKDVFEVCRTIPSLKTSSIIKNKYWVFDSPDQEYLTHTSFRALSKIDAIWFFKATDNPHPQGKYRIIHEIKTGRYDIDEIFEKYYSGMGTQIWVWGWKEQNAAAIPTDPKCTAKIAQGMMKKIDIEYLVPLICPYLKEFYRLLDGDVLHARL